MMARIDPEKIEVRGRIEHQTENAVLVDVDTSYGGYTARRKVWFPLSQVHSIHREFATKGQDRLYVTPWIAREKGVIDETD